MVIISAIIIRVAGMYIPSEHYVSVGRSIDNVKVAWAKSEYNIHIKGQKMEVIINEDKKHNNK